MRAHAKDVLLRAFGFGQGATNEIVDTISHHARVFLNAMRRIACLLQGIVARIAQVVNRIE